MPTAPEYLRDEWDHPDDMIAINYLKSQGYTLGRDWHWTLPAIDHVITEKEGRAIDYLVMEWDFGGVK